MSPLVVTPSGSSRNGSFPQTPTSGQSGQGPRFPAVKVMLSPGDFFTVQASPSTLRTHIGLSYWSPFMENVCDGKMVGALVRYTGDQLVLMQFKPARVHRSGKRYAISISIPQEYLVPVPHHRIGGVYGAEGSLPHEGISQVQEMCPFDDGTSVQSPHMCVVCGLNNRAGEMRKHGYKCNVCVGKTSLRRLRDEAQRLGPQDSQSPTPSASPTTYGI
jgi:hypothetical protein